MHPNCDQTATTMSNRLYQDTARVLTAWVRTVRQDCLDHLLVLSRQHLETILADYVDHYNRARPHRGLQLTPPRSPAAPHATGAIRRRDVLGGLIHEYELAA